MAKIVLKEKHERREGMHLHIKGDRCSSPKCALTRRNYPPGVHGPTARSRTTPYGQQFREKQRAKLTYGILERQFRRYFDKATQSHGDTSVFLIRALETRLDNVVFRMGFATSRRGARQMVNHGHFLVNGKRVNIPSYAVRQGDTVTLKENKRASPLYASFKERASKITIPVWLATNPENYEGKMISAPEGDDLHTAFDPKLIIEFYSR